MHLGLNKDTYDIYRAGKTVEQTLKQRTNSIYCIKTIIQKHEIVEKMDICKTDEVCGEKFVRCAYLILITAYNLLLIKT